MVAGGGGGGAAFPVVFFDGQQEVSIGRMRVNPMMDFKNFQFMISRRIGISPNQISIYLCNRKSDRKKTPITGRVNFEFVVACEKDCFILAVLKRSRKSSRKRRPRANWMGECEDLLWESEFAARSPPPLGNLILLRRNQPEFHVTMMNPADPVFSGFGPHRYDQISQGELAGLNSRFQDLNIQKQNYALAMARSNPDPNPTVRHDPDPTSEDDPDPSSELDPNGLPNMKEIFSAMTEDYGSKCEECVGKKKKKKNGETAAFHPCADDPVLLESFRTRVGPIRRPSV